MKALTPRLRGLADPRIWRVAAGAVIAACVGLFFSAKSPLWLDEAQTVWIAHLPLSHLFSALKEDGAPPLFYVLLHGWMAVFGNSSEAVRALPAAFAVLSLPAYALLARRVPMLRSRPWVPVLLLATCPFVVRYASETRMYSLMLLLVIVAGLTFERVWVVGGVGWTVAAGVVGGGLLLTQYWTLYLLLVVGAAAVVGAARGDRRARRVVASLLVAAAILAPWLPTLAYQSAHTGSPWGAPPGIDVVLLSLGSWAGGGIAGPWIGYAYYALVVVALFGYAADGGGLHLRRPARRLPLALLGIGAATMLLGVVASQIGKAAYAPRYSMVVLPIVMLIVAIAIVALPRGAQLPVLAALCALGLISSLGIPSERRTQAGQVARVLERYAAPNDLVVICPDQLGPAIYRLAPQAGRQVVYPTFGSPAMVDWVDYAARNESADPLQFAQTALHRAADRPIWLVWESGYPTFGSACRDLFTDFALARGTPLLLLSSSSHAFESEQVMEFPSRSSAPATTTAATP